jgi:flavorubredoxin
MKAREIKPRIYRVDAADRDRRLFDKLIPLTDGTGCNSCLNKGSEKAVLIDMANTTTEKHQHLTEAVD